MPGFMEQAQAILERTGTTVPVPTSAELVKIALSPEHMQQLKDSLLWGAGGAAAGGAGLALARYLRPHEDEEKPRRGEIISQGLLGALLGGLAAGGGRAAYGMTQDPAELAAQAKGVALDPKLKLDSGGPWDKIVDNKWRLGLGAGGAASGAGLGRLVKTPPFPSARAYAGLQGAVNEVPPVEVPVDPIHSQPGPASLDALVQQELLKGDAATAINTGRAGSTSVWNPRAWRNYLRARSAVAAVPGAKLPTSSTPGAVAGAIGGGLAGQWLGSVIDGTTTGTERGNANYSRDLQDRKEKVMAFLKGVKQ